MTANIIPIRPFDTVVVYGKTKGCPGCFATKRHLDNQGTAYTYIDTDQDEAAAQMLRDMGFFQAPVIMVGVEIGPGGLMIGGDVWTGYNPKKCDALAYTWPFDQEEAA